MNRHNETKIVDSWHKNAAQWTAAVRGGHIESRSLVTDGAIVEAVLRHTPESVLDIGCGEGWLCRQLAPAVANRVGIDAVADLIERARAGGGGQFHVASYDALSKRAITGQFDVLVCNFSLIGKASVAALFNAVPSYLKPGGAFVVQTLHPVFANDGQYIDGWRAGSWAGFDPGFTDPAPWYFRTLESWAALFSANGLALREIREPIHPKTQKPASIIFTGVAA